MTTKSKFNKYKFNNTRLLLLYDNILNKKYVDIMNHDSPYTLYILF